MSPKARSGTNYRLKSNLSRKNTAAHDQALTQNAALNLDHGRKDTTTPSGNLELLQCDSAMA